MDNAHLALVLPGRAYGPDAPALRLPQLALEQAGATCMAVEYPGGVAIDRDTWGPVLEAAHHQVGQAISAHRPRRVTFLAKSLGTAVLAGLPPGATGEAEVSAIWLTPLFGDNWVRQGALDKDWSSLVVAGGADPLHSPAAQEEVCRRPGWRSLVVDGADHSLEVAGDVRATVAGLARLVDEVLALVGTGAPSS